MRPSQASEKKKLTREYTGRLRRLAFPWRCRYALTPSNHAAEHQWCTSPEAETQIHKLIGRTVKSSLRNPTSRPWACLCPPTHSKLFTHFFASHVAHSTV